MTASMDPRAMELERYKLLTEFSDYAYSDNTVVHTTYESGQLEVSARWKRVKGIGAGAFGAVSLEENEAGDLRAVKCLTKAGLEVDFSRELHVLAELRAHRDRFVHFLGWFEDTQFIFIAMEYTECGDLRKYMKCSRAEARKDVREITRQILRGLVILHGKNICHRDLNPQNILIASFSPIWIKIADFGVSKCETGTQLRTHCGTPGYRAPEQQGMLPQKFMPGGSYTNAVDLWALGSLVHEILTSEIPFLLEVNPEALVSSLGSEIATQAAKYATAQAPDWWLLFKYCDESIGFPTKSLETSRAGKEAIDFVKGLLIVDPRYRMSASDALMDPWLLQEIGSKTLRNELSRSGAQMVPKWETDNQLQTHFRMPGYRAPKQQGVLPQIFMSGGSYTNSVHLWAFGSLLHEILEPSASFFAFEATLVTAQVRLTAVVVRYMLRGGSDVTPSSYILRRGYTASVLTHLTSLRMSIEKLLAIDITHTARGFIAVAAQLSSTDPRNLEGLKDLLIWLRKDAPVNGEFGTRFSEAIAARGGKAAVNRASAVVPGFADAGTILIRSNYENLAKFKSENGDSFRKVCEYISLVADKAPEKTSRNWGRLRRMGAIEIDGMKVTFEIPFDLRYHRNPHFIGRSGILEGLQRHIKRKTSLPVVLYGITGIGKTQIVIEYIYRFILDYTSIFWIDAATKEKTQDGFRKAAQRLVKEHAQISHDKKPDYGRIAEYLDMVGAVDEEGRISPQDEYSECVVRGVKKWLDNDRNQNWLLVFDNADPGRFKIQDFLPSSSHGTILITSRRPSWGALGIPLEVPGMLHPEAEDLLLKSLGLGAGPNRRMTSDIIGKLGGLPIAIIQAGAYVGARNISFRKYEEIFDKSYAKVMREIRQDLVFECEEHPILVTWDISFQAVKRANESAAELLSLCSFISNEDIGKDMICRGRGLKEDDLGDYTMLLFSYSLIQRTASEDSFSIDSVVHAWARERLQPEERIQKAKEAAALLGHEVSYTYKQTNYWASCEGIIGHVGATSAFIKKYPDVGMAGQDLVISLGWLARVNKSWGRWETAGMLQQLVVEGIERVRGKVDRDVLTAKTDLALIYRRQGRWEEAENLQCEVMKQSRELLGKGD